MCPCFKFNPIRAANWKKRVTKKAKQFSIKIHELIKHLCCDGGRSKLYRVLSMTINDSCDR